MRGFALHLFCAIRHEEFLFLICSILRFLFLALFWKFMPSLIFTTLLWAFSFSLIGAFLAGQVDIYFSVFTRILLAGLVFLPFLKYRAISPKLAIKIMCLGATQLGVMYLFYYHSFHLLSVPEILIFTIFTPIYVTAIYDLLERHFNPLFLIGAFFAVLGALIIRWDQLTSNYVLGFLVVQGANICFAIGQVGYKRLIANEKTLQNLPQRAIFGWFYLGAFVIAFPAWILLGTAKYPTTNTQWLVLLWLGIGASALGYFLWNKGATEVKSGVLAIMNNALIPAGILVNLLLWNKSADLPRLFIGGLVIVLSLWFCKDRQGLPKT